MTERFATLSTTANQVMKLIILVAILTSILPPVVSAQTENKTKLPLEIKTIPNFSIPTIADLTDLLNKEPKRTDGEPEVLAASLIVEEVVIIEEPKTIPQPQISVSLPAKVTAENRVYMHEPEIRAYICPKIGDQACNTFIAILKAENGTHECTRDNRGLNRNGTVDIGLAQINWKPGNPWHSFEQLQDCKYNLDVALEMYQRRGFQPWYAYTKGAYKRFL